jgi:hypothetical protein
MRCGAIGHDGPGSADCDLVIEAITEAREAKLALFADLDQICKPGAILATNTSSFRVAEVAAATKRPSLVGGLHYFFPPVINKLLEVVRTGETGEVVETLLNFGRPTASRSRSDLPGCRRPTYCLAQRSLDKRWRREHPDDRRCGGDASGSAWPARLLTHGRARPITLRYRRSIGGRLFNAGDAPARRARRRTRDLPEAIRPAAGRQDLLVRCCGRAVVEEGAAFAEDTDRAHHCAGPRPFAIMNNLGSAWRS